MGKALTTKAIEAAKPSDHRREIPDPALSGLYLVVQPSGVKSWALRYRYAGKPKKLTLGRWPVMGLADARAAATDAIEALEHGNDPSAAKKATKAARMEAQLSERDKIKTLVEQFGKRHLSTLKSGETVKRELNRHVVAVWGERDIHDIAKRDVIDLLDGIADSGRVVTANRVRAYLNKFLSWCVERDIIDQSPAMGVKPAAKEKSRDRVLSDDEIRLFWQACDREGQPWGHLGKMLLLTGQRLGEVVNMTDREVSGDLWHLEADRTKNGRAHDVPLSGAAQDVLGAMERVKSDAGYIFTTTGESALQGYHKGRNHIADRMTEIAGQEIPHWTFHDLRRTAATGMARLGIPVRVTEAVLNHVSGTAGGVVSVYQRHDYADEKRDALNAWGRLVGELVEGTADNVVRLEAKL
ncbi:integrase arm-type DNA-binding domain-containing protein [Aliiroseovarius sp. S2029]|uniref:tyrosine-type recombinase/integrase n=1 Tax=Aliiroseovarius sp. S2029 TaxID=2936988 RepID=UPI0020C039FE|nr:site-specific integrase [Aliiroseovarius sp. S2029]MCK8483946.1 integrase arm-type DNA-binding domain-containing protein [Aliiroseovarius sp. S2029]